jgi:anti-anti-sigma factor
MAPLDAGGAAEIAIDTTVDQSGAPIVILSGELDSSNAASLEAAVGSLTAGRPERLIFDLSALRFMDSAGIAVLIGATRKVDGVYLRNPSRIVRRVIEVTGLAGLLQIEAS